ncbi:MAG: pyridoxamine 5'-phosphate oxidase family protein [Gammaproteobacteria bacterium]|jgi:general stress protein 26|nr:pyridoxamine 5'-phosphate oxidase family protein [Gammaproteobacteria bacterium]MBT4492461.1 pyridoxamine 5'-phosphate oxidase family protein [Gammaproteobacteria bacterium]MBT7369656.1 pyridoxamine 5'-phosphate oxidase family protein [Gammaproteobacteria bacterium]
MKTILSYLLMVIGIGQALAEPPELNLAKDRDAVLTAARKIIESDPFMTLVTVDAQGQPRTRTVEHSPPDAEMVVYVSTIPSTRKLDQIQNNPKETLYFDGPDDKTYVSIMGHATVHTDIDTIIKNEWREEAAREKFWPDFPDNYVLIRIQPKWLEVVAPDIDSRESDWRPQAVIFD